MPDDPNAIARQDWPTVVASFRAFFEPVDDLEAARETIVFDHEAGEVKLMSPAATYTYRVPPKLRR